MIWNALYNKQSSSNIGTLFAARNFLNERHVPDKPMDDPDSAYSLLEKYTDALILAIFNHEEKVSKEKVPVHSKDQMEKYLDEIVDQYCIPIIPDLSSLELSVHQCPHCEKKYKQAKSLRKHFLSTHNAAESAQSSNDSNDDALFNYSCNALALGLIAKDFTDARQHGDGERIMRLHKFLLLYFKSDTRKVKYSFYTLYTLSQAGFLLPKELRHQLVWERSVNNRGKLDTNSELDREMEHRNRSFKLDCKDFQGKLTDKSIMRASYSYNRVDLILQNHDTKCSIFRPSGRHRSRDCKDDVIQLAKQYSKMEIFGIQPGRYHMAFPGFPKNILMKIYVLMLKDWMKKTTNHFKSLNIFSRSPREATR